MARTGRQTVWANGRKDDTAGNTGRVDGQTTEPCRDSVISKLHEWRLMESKEQQRATEQ